MLHFVRALGSTDRTFELAGEVRSFLLTHNFCEEKPRRGSRELRFRRGNPLATFFAFDPSRWRIDVVIYPRTRAAQMFVYSDGQIVTPREQRYFQAFFDELLSVMSPADAPESALAIWGDESRSRQAARAALNQNVGTTMVFLLLLPMLIGLLHAAVAVPMFWAILWGMFGALAIAYAWLFSVKHRAGASAPPLADGTLRRRLPR